MAIGTWLPPSAPGRRVPPENWHLTLRFLGDTPPDARDRVLRQMEQVRMGRGFMLRFGRLGAFPGPGRARILWLGVEEGAPELGAVAAAVENAVRGAGFSEADKPFKAHLTLSRLRTPQPVSTLVEAAPALGVWMPVSEVVLYESRTGRGPARYEPIAHFALSAGEPLPRNVGL